MLSGIHRHAKAVAQQLRFPFGKRVWRGQGGNFQGAGVGSSVDFQDHRPYLPGDDIRYINWQAYARTGHYIIKLYREEVRPSLDLVVDFSASMHLTPQKARRAMELLYFAVENALQAEASLRCFLLSPFAARPRQQELNHLLGYHLDIPAAEDAPKDGHLPTTGAQLAATPFRQGSMRVLISDLLFPGDPMAVFHRLASNQGRPLVLVPFDETEANPDWGGTLEFLDVESGRKRLQKVPRSLLDKYLGAYKRHFQMWKDAAQPFDAPLARVSAEDTLVEALKTEALRRGAVEVWS